MGEKLWTLKELAEYWRMKPRTLYKWIASGKLKPSRIGRSVRIPDSQVKELTVDSSAQ